MSEEQEGGYARRVVQGHHDTTTPAPLDDYQRGRLAEVEAMLERARKGKPGKAAGGGPAERPAVEAIDRDKLFRQRDNQAGMPRSVPPGLPADTPEQEMLRDQMLQSMAELQAARRAADEAEAAPDQAAAPGPTGDFDTLLTSLAAEIKDDEQERTR